MCTYLGELILVAGDEVEVSGHGGGCHDGGRDAKIVDGGGVVSWLCEFAVGVEKSEASIF